MNKYIYKVGGLRYELKMKSAVKLLFGSLGFSKWEPAPTAFKQ